MENINKKCVFCSNTRFLKIASFYLHLHGIVGIYMCMECGLMSSFPILDAETIKDLYIERDYLFSGDKAPSGYRDYLKYNAKKMMNYGLAFGRFLKKIKFKGNLLEIGCAYGYFLRGIASSYGWDVMGIEVSPQAAIHARKMGLSIKVGMFEEMQLEAENFDCICMNDVLEHMKDPVACLGKVKDLLKRGGILLLNLPNGGSDVRLFTRNKKILFSPHYHLHFFQEGTIRRILDRFEFKVIVFKKKDCLLALRIMGVMPTGRVLYYVDTAGEKTKISRLEKCRSSEYLRNALGLIKDNLAGKKNNFTQTMRIIAQKT